MQSDKQSKVIIDTMNHDEVAAFCKFLDSEIVRHKDDIEQVIRTSLVFALLIVLGEDRL